MAVSAGRAVGPVPLSGGGASSVGDAIGEPELVGVPVGVGGGLANSAGVGAAVGIAVVAAVGMAEGIGDGVLGRAGLGDNEGSGGAIRGDGDGVAA